MYGHFLELWIAGLGRKAKGEYYSLLKPFAIATAGLQRGPIGGHPGAQISVAPRCLNKIPYVSNGHYSPAPLLLTYTILTPYNFYPNGGSY